MAEYKQFRGVSDIVEDGYGGFTMDSVFYHANGSDRYVTSVFKKVDPKSSTESENWNPTSFNFKAAVGGSPPRKKTEVPGERIKEVHQSKKGSSRRKKEARDPMVKRHLGEAFEDPCSDILTDVTNEFGMKTEKTACAGRKEQVKKDQEMGEHRIKELMKNLKEDHGINCDCGEYVKGVMGHYESLGIFPFDLSKEKDQEEKSAEDKGKKVASADEEEDRMDDFGSEEGGNDGF